MCDVEKYVDKYENKNKIRDSDGKINKLYISFISEFINEKLSIHDIELLRQFSNYIKQNI